MISEYPKYDEGMRFEKEEGYMESVMSIIRGVRNQRSEMNVPPSKKAALIVRTDKPEVINSCSAYLAKLAYASTVSVIAPDEQAPKNAASCVTDIGEVYMPLGDLIDVEKETARLQKELDKLEKEIGRLSGKLSNEGFLKKAPEAVVAKEREKLAGYEEKKQAVEGRIQDLAKL